MSTPLLDSIEFELRRAVARGQINIAANLIAAYGCLAADQLKLMGTEDSSHRSRCEHVISVLEWVRLMLNTQRCGLAEQLGSAHKATHFLTKPEPGPASFFGLDV